MAAGAAVALVGVGCGGSGDEGAVPTLRWFTFQEPGGAFDEIAQGCTEAAEGRYRIQVEVLPSSADQQREQLVRRLAASDSSIDLMGMDVIWTPEFAEAGWILPWEGDAAATVTEGRLEPTVQSATYEDTLYAAPFYTNTQLLWYRSDLMDEPPATWDELLEISEQLGADGEPDDIQVQANRYEGLTVFFTTLLGSAGGEVIDDEGNVALADEPTERALEVLRDVTTAGGAPANVSTSTEDTARLGFEIGESAFMLNYTFVYASARDNAPDIFEVMEAAPFPEVTEGEPSQVTIGGLNVGVGAYSEHPDLAFEAAACIVQPDNQITTAELGGLPPASEELYDDPAVQEVFPFADALRETLANATQRAQSPAYNDISLAIQRELHPTTSIDPAADVDSLRARVDDAVNSQVLL